MELSLVLDVVVAVLLAATIGYAAVLNRRLQGLRANKAEFEAMIGEFNEATRRTEGAIQALRLAADQTAKALSVQVERGQALRDELAFLTNRADGTAERIATGGAARPEVAAYAASPKPAQSRPQPAAAAPPRAAANTAAPPRPQPAPEPEEADGDGGRSKAEQDLLKALRELR
jgi:hypothetical protein